MPDRQIQIADTALKAAPLAYILTFLPVATNREAGHRGFVTGDVALFFPEHHMRFADIGLSDELLRALSEAGYDEPTPIQAAAIPQVQMMRDIIAIAQTGTGKTASFVLPMIDVLANGRARAHATQPHFGANAGTGDASGGEFRKIRQISQAVDGAADRRRANG